MHFRITVRNIFLKIWRYLCYTHFTFISCNLQTAKLLTKIMYFTKWRMNEKKGKYKNEIEIHFRYIKRIKYIIRISLPSTQKHFHLKLHTVFRHSYSDSCESNSFLHFPIRVKAFLQNIYYRSWCFKSIFRTWKYWERKSPVCNPLQSNHISDL